MALSGQVAARRAPGERGGRQRRPAGRPPLCALRPRHRLRPDRTAWARAAASARLTEDEDVEITLPDSSRVRDDDALSDWLGRRVALRSAEQNSERHYENPLDVEREQSSRWEAFTGAPGPFHDSSRTRVSLVSTVTLGAWGRRRFRSNVLLEGSGERDLVGSSVRFGGSELEVGKHIERCAMVTRAQPDGIERDLTVLRTIAQQRQNRLAVGALVSRPGVVSVSDVVERLSR